MRVWLPSVMWAALIFALSHKQGDELPPFPLPFADKIAHAALYAVLGALLYRGFRRGRNSAPGRAALYAFIVACIYGGIDEIHQYFVQGRQMSAADWAADAVGAAAAGIAARMQKRRGGA